MLRLSAAAVFLLVSIASLKKNSCGLAKCFWHLLRSSSSIYPGKVLQTIADFRQLRLRLQSIVGVKFDYKLIKLCVSVVKSNGLIDLQWGFSSRLLDPSRFTLIIPLCNCLFSSQDFSSLLKLISLLFSCFVSCHLSFAIFSLDLFELLHNRNRIEIEWKYFVVYQINAESLTKTMIKGS